MRSVLNYDQNHQFKTGNNLIARKVRELREKEEEKGCSKSSSIFSLLLKYIAGEAKMNMSKQDETVTFFKRKFRRIFPIF